MLMQSLVIAGGLALAVSLPLVALAITTDQTPPLDDIAVAATDDLPQPAFQQRLRVHSETGPPEGFEPVRQRLHQPESVGTGQQNMMYEQPSDRAAGGSMHGKNSADCPNDGEPCGAAHGRSGGAGGNGQGGNGQGGRGKG